MRAQYDKAGPPSTTLADWVRGASHKELLALLERNGHPMWFVEGLDRNPLENYAIVWRWEMEKGGRGVIPWSAKKEWKARRREEQKAAREEEKIEKEKMAKRIKKGVR